MQFSQKTFGSQNAIKQLYRQYSTTFKNNQIDKNKTMTQSSNLPFDKIYNAFNSTGNMHNFVFDRFKHSEAKSIIQKLMQTKQITPKNKEDDFPLLNQIQNVPSSDSKGPIPLNDTEQKIFCEVVNLITEISEIKEKTQQQNQEFLKLKIQLKNQGIQIPQIQQKRTQLNPRTFKRYTNEELFQIFEQNEALEAEIQKITKQLTNKNEKQEEQTVLESVSKQNSILKKQLSAIKSEIIDAGQIDEQQMNELNLKIENLKRTILMLQQKRLGKLTDKDEEYRMLKSQNQKLRLKTIQMLKSFSNPTNQKKSDLIKAIKVQEQQKKYYAEQISILKSKYQNLQNENLRLNQQGSTQMGVYYDGPLQVESKVSPFYNYGEYHSSYGYDKQNYYQNYEPERLKKNINPSAQYQKYKYSNEGLGNYDSYHYYANEKLVEYENKSYTNNLY